MSRITEAKIIYEFTNNEFEQNAIYGVYHVIFNGQEKVFIRNEDSVGVISHSLGEPASKCVSIIRDDVKEEFFKFIEEIRKLNVKR